MLRAPQSAAPTRSSIRSRPRRPPRQPRRSIDSGSAARTTGSRRRKRSIPRATQTAVERPITKSAGSPAQIVALAGRPPNDDDVPAWAAPVPSRWRKHNAGRSLAGLPASRPRQPPHRRVEPSTSVNKNVTTPKEQPPDQRTPTQNLTTDTLLPRTFLFGASVSFTAPVDISEFRFRPAHVGRPSPQDQATCELSSECRRIRSHGHVIKAHTMRTITVSANRYTGHGPNTSSTDAVGGFRLR